MSRTPKRGKPPGFDLWGKTKISGIPPAKGIKRLINQTERAVQKELLRKEEKQR